MERKTLGIIALALVGLMAISFVAAMPFTTEENHEAIRAAVEAGDFDSWKSLRSSELTEENFEKMTQMHELRTQLREAREAGDNELVQSLTEELTELMPEGMHGKGFGNGFGRGAGHGQGKGMMQGQNGACPFAE